MVEFKFMVGEIVGNAAGQPMQVIERVARQCYGGQQNHYSCRPIGNQPGFIQGVGMMMDFSEIELFKRQESPLGLVAMLKKCRSMADDRQDGETGIALTAIIEDIRKRDD